MTDPTRILQSDDSSETDVLGRQLLLSLSPSPAERRRVMAGVLAQGAALTVAGVVAKEGAAAVASSNAVASSSVVASNAALTSNVVTTKAGLGGLWALSAVPVLGAALFLYSPWQEDPPSSVAPAASHLGQVDSGSTEKTEKKDAEEFASSSEADALQLDHEKPSAEEPTTRSPASQRSVHRSKADAESSLLAEDRLLRAARSALKAGNTADAAARLKELDRQFPRGALLQEREVLRIAVLRKTGNNHAADVRASDFRQRYPDSPYDGAEGSGVQTKPR